MSNTTWHLSFSVGVSRSSMLLQMAFFLYLWLSNISLYTYVTVKNIETYYLTIALTWYLMISFIFMNLVLVSRPRTSKLLLPSTELYMYISSCQPTTSSWWQSHPGTSKAVSPSFYPAAFVSPSHISVRLWDAHIWGSLISRQLWQLVGQHTRSWLARDSGTSWD